MPKIKCDVTHQQKARRLAPEEWNFTSLGDDEVVPGFVYEFARESQFISAIQMRQRRGNRAEDEWSQVHDACWPGHKALTDEIWGLLLKITINLPFAIDQQGLRNLIRDSILGPGTKPWLALSNAARKSIALTLGKAGAFYRGGALNLGPIQTKVVAEQKQLDLKHFIERKAWLQRQAERFGLGDRGAKSQIVDGDFGIASSEEPYPLHISAVPKFLDKNGRESGVFNLDWGSHTNQEIKDAVCSFVDANRPSSVPGPSKRGKKLGDLHAALKALGLMRIFAFCSYAEMATKAPDAWRMIQKWSGEAGPEKECNRLRTKAFKNFRRIFPFETSPPLSWETATKRARKRRKSL
jgi:hypothetical protein